MAEPFDSLIKNEFPSPIEYEYWPALEEGSQKLMIVLHGRGDSSEGFHWLPGQLGIDSFHFLFLNAPEPYGSGFSWYDLPPRQGPGIERSRAMIHGILDHLLSSETLKSSDLFLFGFSQGCLMAIDVALRYPRVLGGVVGLSGYVHFLEQYPQAFSPVARSQRFLITHGSKDEVLPMRETRGSIERLRGYGASIQWQELDKGHSIDPESEMELIAECLNRWLTAS